jgi:ribosome maturation factor RimP
MQIEQKVCEIIEPPLSDLGYEVVRAKYFNRGKANILQIMIDRTDQTPITIDDCEKVSHTVSALLDVEDPISDAYNLEVSSPGIDRPLVKLKDYIKYKGYDIIVHLYNPVDNNRNPRGKLEDVIDNNIIMNAQGLIYKIDIQNINSAKLVLTDKLLKK